LLVSSLFLLILPALLRLMKKSIPRL
jgi:hypothetical protein